MIHIRATQPGYYDHYREEGEEFSIADEAAFSERWMVRVLAPKTEAKTEKSAKEK